MRLSRDPALYVGLAAAAIQFFSAMLFPLTAEQQVVLNAAVVAIAGFATAVWVRRDGQAAALVGLAQAVIAVALGFGLKLGADQQASIMALITTAVALWTRTQVTAKVDAVGNSTY